MSLPGNFFQLTGRWQGSNRLWLSPSDPARVSETNAIVSRIGRERFIMIAYTWFENELQEGQLVIGQQGTEVKAFWIDSWHNGDRIMPCEGIVTADGQISVRGSYPAPPGPDWGWRITIEAGEPFKLTMFNITPDGQENLAVEAIYARLPGS
jgi:Protein of unknown function (DUF1579)